MRSEFFTELRRRTDAAVINGEDRPNGFTFGDAAVLFDGGEILAPANGKLADRCPISDFIRRPNAVFRQLMRSVKKAAEPDPHTE